jgi:2-(1,2-epoxy-1,2-dihydrophenyl)acetyl-CoA isomerase
VNHPVDYTVESAVATITLNRPEALNALDTATKDALREAVSAASADPAVRSVLLTGAGRAFSAGQDLREQAAAVAAGDIADTGLDTLERHFNPITEALATMPKPTIAAVAGPAAGAGAGFAFACDFRVVAEDARFILAFVGIGLSADSGASWTLPRLVGRAKATELLLLGEPVGADAALAMGLVTAVVPTEKLAEAGRELATRLAAGPTTAYAAIKEALAFSATASLPESLAEEARLQRRAGATRDHAAAVAAFLDKRPPVFEGS